MSTMPPSARWRSRIGRPMRDLGAHLHDGGSTFVLWAPGANAVRLFIRRETAEPRVFAMETARDGFFEAFVEAAASGDRYAFSPDGRGPFPDPASRYQPDGLHDWSEIIDPSTYSWSDGGWRPPSHLELSLYEMHVGAFTLEGTLSAAAMRLPDLRDLGVAAIQLMPMAEFPGPRDWGYNCALPFALSHEYGRPDDLRRFIDVAHRLGLAVILEVVYSHASREGYYFAEFDPRFTLPGRVGSWGPPLNLDGEGSSAVRAILRENALRWMEEYHADGFHLGATHADLAGALPAFVAELTATVRTEAPDRRIFVIVDGLRDPSRALRPASRGGWGVDAVWSDIFHQLTTRIIFGDRGAPAGAATPAPASSHLRAASELAAELATPRMERAPPHCLVAWLETHQEVGGRPRGERLHHLTALAVYRAASTLLLLAPQIPLLFMGQEWGASSPFHYFAHAPAGREEELLEERRAELVARFGEEAVRVAMPLPDPTAMEFYLASRLRWEERLHGSHAALLRMHRRLLMLRKSERSLNGDPAGSRRVASVIDGETLALRRENPPGLAILLVVRLAGSGEAVVGGEIARLALPATRWRRLFSTEDSFWTSDPRPLETEEFEGKLRIVFTRPAAVIFRATRAA